MSFFFSSFTSFMFSIFLFFHFSFFPSVTPLPLLWLAITFSRLCCPNCFRAFRLNSQVAVCFLARLSLRLRTSGFWEPVYPGYLPYIRVFLPHFGRIPVLPGLLPRFSKFDPSYFRLPVIRQHLVTID